MLCFARCRWYLWLSVLTSLAVHIWRQCHGCVSARSVSEICSFTWVLNTLRKSTSWSGGRRCWGRHTNTPRFQEASAQWPQWEPPPKMWLWQEVNIESSRCHWSLKVFLRLKTFISWVPRDDFLVYRRSGSALSVKVDSSPPVTIREMPLAMDSESASRPATSCSLS